MMRKLTVFLFVPVIGLALLKVAIPDWNQRFELPVDFRMVANSTSMPVLLPTEQPILIDATATPPDRTLPPIGGNAGLVLGASVLVLIIIGGVVFISRRKAKH